MEFNKAVLDCMQTLRRRLRDEQHLQIRLSQPDAIPLMLEACLASHDELTHELGNQLAAQSGIEQAPKVAPAPLEEPRHSVRIYRGQRVLA